MDDSLIDFGVSTRPFVVPKPQHDAVIVGGKVGEQRWTRVVSRRAAHTMWYHLTELLYPERARQITTRAATAPIRSDVAPTITSHVEVFRGEGDYIEILGTGGQREWLTRLNEHDGRALWAALDKMLFPLGWEGADQRTPKPPAP